MSNGAWTTANLPPLSGKTVVVTGANSGIGFSAARVFAARGARVVLAVRNVTKGAEAARTIAGSVSVEQLDLADLASVRHFARHWEDDIDLLINNAGVMAPPLSRTPDGFESQFGTNHLGHFALTNLLLPQIRGRVVSVSSLAHRAGHIDFADPNWRTRRYSRWQAYGQSKLANLLFVLELQRRLTSSGSTILATAAHPGWAATNLQRSNNRFASAGIVVANRLFAQDAAAGALPTLYASTADIPGASFVGPNGRGQTRGTPTLVGRSDAAADATLARRLWDLSEELTGVTEGR